MMLLDAAWGWMEIFIIDDSDSVVDDDDVVAKGDWIL